MRLTPSRRCTFGRAGQQSSVDEAGAAGAEKPRATVSRVPSARALDPSTPIEDYRSSG